jgi:hypothetical protein
MSSFDADDAHGVGALLAKTAREPSAATGPQPHSGVPVTRT